MNFLQTPILNVFHIVNHVIMEYAPSQNYANVNQDTSVMVVTIQFVPQHVWMETVLNLINVSVIWDINSKLEVKMSVSQYVIPSVLKESVLAQINANVMMDSTRIVRPY